MNVANFTDNVWVYTLRSLGEARKLLLVNVEDRFVQLEDRTKEKIYKSEFQFNIFPV
jgi:hypothetical protein